MVPVTVSRQRFMVVLLVIDGFAIRAVPRRVRSTRCHGNTHGDEPSPPLWPKLWLCRTLRRQERHFFSDGDTPFPPFSLLRFQGLSRRGGTISSGRASDHSRRGAKISLYRKIASFQASAGKHLPRANIDTREWVNILTPVKQTAAYQLTGSKTDIRPTVLCT